MIHHPPKSTPGLSGRDAEHLAHALGSRDVTIFVDGTSVRLPGEAREAVVDLLSRLARGEATTVFSAPADRSKEQSEPGAASDEELLTTSQAAALAGVSATFLRKLTGRGVIPVEYRGTHRRVRRTEVEAWLERQTAAGHDGGAPPGPAPAPEELLTTSRAAALAGISPTHLRNLTSQGVIPVHYRGTHRRIRVADVEAWLAGRARARNDDTSAPREDSPAARDDESPGQ